MLKCPFCQFENEDGALFCEQCKSDLGAPEPAVVAHAEPASETVGTERPVETLPLAVETTDHAGPPEAVAEAVPVAEVAADLAAPYAEPASPEIAAEAVPVASGAQAPAPEESPAPVTEPASALRAASIPGVAQQPGEAPAGSAAKPRLVVLRGQRINAEYPLYEGENFIGRADEKAVDIDLEDQEPPDRIWSSRQHALIALENGSMTIEDLNSLNGTYVNRTRVHPGQKRPLQINDVIQIGTVQMKVKA
jgi:FHA domain